jgi:uncharacterized protein YbaP (TraB family)
MKIRLSILLFGVGCLFSVAQNSAVKYQGLLWEISGKNLKKPSYLFGTMHVSSKVAFHLGDAFYTSIKNADVVALETNPDEMQDDYTQSVFQKVRAAQGRRRSGVLARNTFTLSDSRNLLQAALSYDPEMLNQLLYRSYLTMEEFEENTFLDLYIYQVGKKLGKRATGVENFRESEQLVLEALRDMAKEMKGRKNRADDLDEDEYKMLQPHILTDAYRSGNLDLLDSLSRKQYRSDAFLEKFLYRRNENMFHAIDSIVQRSSLFVGVGAAHLPGERGLINMLRKAGYAVKPIRMGERDSEQKDQIEKLRVEQTFATQTSEDGWFQVDLPGKLYDFSNQDLLVQRQYADLANGTYYAVSRVKTNALFLGQSPEAILSRVDSLLYEHIPGKILSKTPVTKNGYPGFNVTNRSRRGDSQRYQILVTPFEVFIFKMSGTGDYVEGKEADRFFNSIRLKEIASTPWQAFTPVKGGFQVRMPHVPASNESLGSEKTNVWEAWDKTTGNTYLVQRQSATGLVDLEEDTTDLSIMEESYLASDFIKKTVSRKFLTYKGYPCLEVVSKTRNGSHNLTRFVIKGVHYYVLSANYTKDRKTVQDFFDSFSFQDFTQEQVLTYTDTTLAFSVKIPKGSEPDEGEKLRNLYSDYLPEAGTKDEDYRMVQKSLTFASPSSGEEVTVSYQKFPKYYSFSSEKRFWEGYLEPIMQGKIVAKKEQKSLGDAVSYYVVLRDTNSSRSLVYRFVLRNRVLYTLQAAADTLQERSAFVQTLFDSFLPTGTAVGKSVYASRAAEFLEDFTHANPEIRQNAKDAIHYVEFTESDAARIIQTLRKLNPRDKGYLDSKRLLIGQLGSIRHASIVPYLKAAYQQSNDTTTLQYAILNALALQKTPEAYAAFKEIVLNETPIFNNTSDIHGLFSPLHDSLALAKVLFPDLLKLASLSDYKSSVYGLLASLADSNYVSRQSYEPYLSQMIYDARIESKRHFAKAEERQLAEENTEDEAYYEPSELESSSELVDFATLLAPYLTTHKTVDRFFERLLQSSDQSLLIEVAALLLKNKQPVADSLLKAIAANDQYRVPLYIKLRAIRQLDRFPKKYVSQEAMARSLLYQQEAYLARADTISYLSRQLTGYNLKRGYVYFYKYRKPDNPDWYIAVSGLQPVHEKSLETTGTLVRLTDKKIKKGKSLSEQLSQTLRDLKLEGRWEDTSVYVEDRGF